MSCSFVLLMTLSNGKRRIACSAHNNSHTASTSTRWHFAFGAMLS